MTIRNCEVEMVIDVACGQKPLLSKKTTREEVEIRFIFTKQELDKLEEIKRQSPEKLYRISGLELENLGNTVDSSSRVGYYILRGRI